MMDAIQKINEIDALLKQDELGLPVGLGSIARCSHFGYPNYGIVFQDEREAELVRNISIKSYLAEWTDSDWRMHALIRDAVGQTSFRRSGAQLNGGVGFITNELIESREDQDLVKIFDFGTGEGDTTDAILARILKRKNGKSLLSRLVLCLNDVSEMQLPITAQRLNEKYGVQVETAYGWGSDVLRNFENEFDFIVSSGVLHHESFSPFQSVYQALKNDGAVVVADYCTRLFDHPVRLVRFLESIGADRKRIKEFRKYFGVCSDSDITREERIAVSQTINYLKSLIALIQKAEMDNVGYFPIEAQRSGRQIAKEMTDANFCIDMGVVKRAFPKSFSRSKIKTNIRIGNRNSDVANIVVGVKKTK
jgi:hypothetical protein